MAGFNISDNLIVKNGNIGIGTSDPSQRLVVSGDATVNGNLYLSDQMRIGDDAWIEDFNVANSIRIKGNQSSSQGYIAFGNRTELLGQNNSGTLTFNGNTVWHAGNATGGGDDGPAFQAHTHATGTGPPQTLANNTWTKCNFGHEVVDTDNCYDHSNSRFTPDVAGWYIINCSVLLSSTSTTWYNRIRKNSATSISESSHLSTAGNAAAIQNSAIVYLNGSTDYVEVDNKQTSGSSIYGPQITFVTYFNGALVRKQ